MNVFKTFRYIHFVCLHFFFISFLLFRSRLTRFVHQNAFFFALFLLSSLHFRTLIIFIGLGTTCTRNKIAQNVKHACKCRLWKPHIHLFLLFDRRNRWKWGIEECSTCSKLNWQPQTDGINLMRCAYSIKRRNILKLLLPHIKILTTQNAKRKIEYHREEFFFH